MQGMQTAYAQHNTNFGNADGACQTALNTAQQAYNDAMVIVWDGYALAMAAANDDLQSVQETYSNTMGQIYSDWMACYAADPSGWCDFYPQTQSAYETYNEAQKVYAVAQAQAAATVDGRAAVTVAQATRDRNVAVAALAQVRDGQLAAAAREHDEAYADADKAWADVAWPAWATYVSIEADANAAWVDAESHAYAAYEQDLAAAHVALVSAIAPANVTYAHDAAQAWADYHVSMTGIQQDTYIAWAQLNVAQANAADPATFAYIYPQYGGSWAPMMPGGVSALSWAYFEASSFISTLGMPEYTPPPNPPMTTTGAPSAATALSASPQSAWGMPSWSDYWYYLTNPSSMTGYVAFANNVAYGMIGIGVGGFAGIGAGAVVGAIGAVAGSGTIATTIAGSLAGGLVGSEVGSAIGGIAGDFGYTIGSIGGGTAGGYGGARAGWTRGVFAVGIGEGHGPFGLHMTYGYASQGGGYTAAHGLGSGSHTATRLASLDKQYFLLRPIPILYPEAIAKWVATKPEIGNCVGSAICALLRGWGL